jgi:hypothetical protein
MNKEGDTCCNIASSKKQNWKDHGAGFNHEWLTIGTEGFKCTIYPYVNYWQYCSEVKVSEYVRRKLYEHAYAYAYAYRLFNCKDWWTVQVSFLCMTLHFCPVWTQGIRRACKEGPSYNARHSGGGDKPLACMTTYNNIPSLCSTKFPWQIFFV